MLPDNLWINTTELKNLQEIILKIYQCVPRLIKQGPSLFSFFSISSLTQKTVGAVLDEK